MEVRTMVYCVPIHSGEVPVTIGYDIWVYEGVNITIGCSPLVEQSPEGSIHWYTQLINPRAVIRNMQELPIPAVDTIQLVVPSTSIPNFLQVSFRCEVCTVSQCWSNNYIISVISNLHLFLPPPPPPPLSLLSSPLPSLIANFSHLSSSFWLTN